MGATFVKADDETRQRAEAFVTKEIQDNRIVVFSKRHCSYSRMAKKALTGIFNLIRLRERNSKILTTLCRGWCNFQGSGT